MTHRMLAGGLIAGFAAGLLAALLHFTFVQDLILLAEDYETGARVHFAGAGHDTGTAAGGAATPDASHDHASDDHGSSGETPDLRRDALTVLFGALIYAGYGLMLTAGFAMADRFGKRTGVREGVLWGVAGFAAFQLAPAMGLAPELPGTIAADLGARQFWWAGTVLATAAGIAALACGRGILALLGGLVLIAVPHLIGAPRIESFYGVAPPELAAEFSARVLGVGLVVWTTLGWLAGRLWARPQS